MKILSRGWATGSLHGNPIRIQRSFDLGRRGRPADRALQSPGAQVLSLSALAEAAAAVALDGVCAAVLDYRLGDDNVATLCEALEGRRIPFVLYSGYCDLQESFPKQVILQKPAHGESLLAAIAELLSPTPAGRCDAELSVASLVNGADVTLPLEVTHDGRRKCAGPSTVLRKCESVLGTEPQLRRCE